MASETRFSAVVHDTGEVIAIGPSGLSLPGRVTQVGLELPEGLSFADWQGIGESLKGVERSLMWWIGDWLRYGESRYGETYAQALDATEISYQSLADAKWVAGKYEFSDRSENLTWTHHRVAAAIDDRDSRATLLEDAAREGLSVRELKARVSQKKAAARIMAPEAGNSTCGPADLYRLAESGAKFGAIYADPPWLYDNQGTRAATGNHYGGLTVDEICALPIRELAADDAHLHLWTTNAFLFDCPRIFDAWGFEFRSSFIWAKTEFGIGNYWRNSHEIMLTAIRGDAKRFNDHSLKSWLECSRGAHSAKPEQVRHFIERASPGPFLELFGRSISPNWVVWGNQIERTIFDHAVKEVA